MLCWRGGAPYPETEKLDGARAGQCGYRVTGGEHRLAGDRKLLLASLDADDDTAGRQAGLADRAAGQPGARPDLFLHDRRIGLGLRHNPG